ncbi:MAG: hypothetical protein ACREOK_02915 [Gemmatimonadaceae bacterium]
MRVPERISRDWIDSLSDEDIKTIEAQLHGKFSTLEKRERKARGDRFSMMHASADLLDAWDRWSRLLNATRERALVTSKRD